MRLVELTTDDDPEFRTAYDEEHREKLNINITEEGIILDAFLGDVPIGTKAMTFQEWFDHVVETDPGNRP